MPDSLMYHEGNRQLQDRFDSRRISDRLEERLTHKEFTADDKAFIETLPYFFLATADADGRPDCSFKGGPPGFVRVTGPSEIAFPDYDGNGMFKSIGNLAVNPHVGLLFIAMHGNPKRLRVNGEARIDRDDVLLSEIVGAQMIVRIKVDAIFPIDLGNIDQPEVRFVHQGGRLQCVAATLAAKGPGQPFTAGGRLLRYANMRAVIGSTTSLTWTQS